MKGGFLGAAAIRSKAPTAAQRRMSQQRKSISRGNDQLSVIKILAKLQNQPDTPKKNMEDLMNKYKSIKEEISPVKKKFNQVFQFSNNKRQENKSPLFHYQEEQKEQNISDFILQEPHQSQSHHNTIKPNINPRQNERHFTRRNNCPRLTRMLQNADHDKLRDSLNTTGPTTKPRMKGQSETLGKILKNKSPLKKTPKFPLSINIRQIKEEFSPQTPPSYNFDSTIKIQKQSSSKEIQPKKTTITIQDQENIRKKEESMKVFKQKFYKSSTIKPINTQKVNSANELDIIQRNKKKRFQSLFINQKDIQKVQPSSQTDLSNNNNSKSSLMDLLFSQKIKNNRIQSRLKMLNYFTYLRLKFQLKSWAKRAKKQVIRRKFRKCVKKVAILILFYQQLKQNKNESVIKRTKFDSQYRRKGMFPLYPEDSVSGIWNVILISLLTITAFWVPYQFSFQEDHHEAVQIIDFIFDVFFFCDIIFNFNCAFYDEQNKLVSNNKKIAKNYIKSWFLIDLITVIPFQYLGFQAHLNKLFRLLRLPRIFKVKKLIKFSKNQTEGLLFHLVEYLNMNLGVKQVLQLTLTMMFLSHTGACLLYQMAKFQDFDSDTWVQDLKEDEASMFEKYVTAQYWAFQTLTVVGYGDIPLNTVSEQIFACFFMCIAMAFQSFIIQTVAMNMGGNQRYNYLQTFLDNFQDMARDFHISPPLTFQVENFFKQNYKHNLFWGTQFYDMIDELPQNYIEEIGIVIYSKLIEQIPFFRIELQFTSLILPSLLFQKTNKHSIIFRKNDIADEIFFILSGQVTILNEDYQILLKIEQGDYFGQEEVLIGSRRKYFAICSAHNTMLLISKQNDFLQKIESFPNVIEELGNVTSVRLEEMKKKVQQAHDQQHSSDHSNGFSHFFRNPSNSVQSIQNSQQENISYYLNARNPNVFQQHYFLNSPYQQPANHIEQYLSQMKQNLTHNKLTTNQSHINLEESNSNLDTRFTTMLFSKQSKSDQNLILTQNSHSIIPNINQFGKQKPNLKLEKSNLYFQNFVQSNFIKKHKIKKFSNLILIQNMRNTLGTKKESVILESGLQLSPTNNIINNSSNNNNQINEHLILSKNSSVNNSRFQFIQTPFEPQGLDNIKEEDMSEMNQSSSRNPSNSIGFDTFRTSKETSFIKTDRSNNKFPHIQNQFQDLTDRSHNNNKQNGVMQPIVSINSDRSNNDGSNDVSINCKGSQQTVPLEDSHSNYNKPTSEKQTSPLLSSSFQEIQKRKSPKTQSTIVNSKQNDDSEHKIEPMQEKLQKFQTMKNFRKSKTRQSTLIKDPFDSARQTRNSLQNQSLNSFSKNNNINNNSKLSLDMLQQKLLSQNNNFIKEEVIEEGQLTPSPKQFTGNENLITFQDPKHLFMNSQQKSSPDTQQSNSPSQQSPISLLSDSNPHKDHIIIPPQNHMINSIQSQNNKKNSINIHEFLSKKDNEDNNIQNNNNNNNNNSDVEQNGGNLISNFLDVKNDTTNNIVSLKEINEDEDIEMRKSKKFSVSSINDLKFRRITKQLSLGEIRQQMLKAEEDNPSSNNSSSSQSSSSSSSLDSEGSLQIDCKLDNAISRQAIKNQESVQQSIRGKYMQIKIQKIYKNMTEVKKQIRQFHKARSDVIKLQKQLRYIIDDDVSCHVPNLKYKNKRFVFGE